MATQVKASPRGFRPPVTVQQWCELEGPPHYELVDGNLLEKAAVALWHEIFLIAFAAYLHTYVTKRKLGVIVTSQGKLKISDLDGREPDIFFIAIGQYHLIGQNLFRGIPSLIVEILSPNSETIDRVEKSEEYANLGVLQYWIIDCPRQRIEVYVLSATQNGSPEYKLATVVEGKAVFRHDIFPRLKNPLRKAWPTDFVHAADE